MPFFCIHKFDKLFWFYWLFIKSTHFLVKQRESLIVLTRPWQALQWLASKLRLTQKTSNWRLDLISHYLVLKHVSKNLKILRFESIFIYFVLRPHRITLVSPISLPSCCWQFYFNLVLLPTSRSLSSFFLGVSSKCKSSFFLSGIKSGPFVFVIYFLLVCCIANSQANFSRLLLFL